MAEKNKICPRCKKEFKCNAENISACSCSQVVLSNETKSFLTNTFFNCLCNDCLTELNQLVAREKNIRFREGVAISLKEFITIMRVSTGYLLNST